MLIPSKHSGYRRDGTRLCPGKSDAPAPDPNVGIAAAESIALAREQYADFKTDYAPYLKEQMAQGMRISNEQNERQGALQEYQLGRAKTYDDRWDSTQVPLEDELIGKARAYNEDAEQERMAAQAGADVNSAYADSNAMMNRDLASRGVNVNSGNYMATARQNAVIRAGAASAAVNKTRQAAKDIGWTRLGEAAALGRGLPTFGTGSAALSMNAGQAAFGAGTAGTGIVGQASGANNAGYTAGGSLYGNAMGGLNQAYGTSASSNAASNNQTGEMLGTVAGIAGMFLMSDRRLKTDIERVGKTDSGMPVYTYKYKDGGPTHMGVMAEDVKRKAPEAYRPKVDGKYDAVDYSKI